MEIKVYKPTAKVTAEMKDGGTMEFTVQRVSNAQFELDYIGQAERRSARCIAILTDAIVGWNLAHDDGTPWECTALTKPPLLAEIVGKPVVRLVGPDGQEIPGSKDLMILGLALFSFVRDEGNFLKN